LANNLVVYFQPALAANNLDCRRLLKKGICPAERSNVMLSPPRRTKHLALVRPFHAKTQSQILRCAQNDSEGLRMTSARGFFSSL
jgi:hypothetical protein